MMFLSRRLFSGVGKPFRSIQEVERYLASPTWSTAELLVKAAQEEGLSRENLESLQQLSGLAVGTGDEEILLTSVRRQLGFIRYIEDLELPPVQGTNKDTRLIPQPQPLRYADMKKVHAPVMEKGELSGTWNPTKLATDSEDGYFVVKDSLVKGE